MSGKQASAAATFEGSPVVVDFELVLSGMGKGAAVGGGGGIGSGVGSGIGGVGCVGSTGSGMFYIHGRRRFLSRQLSGRDLTFAVRA